MTDADCVALLNRLKGLGYLSGTEYVAAVERAIEVLSADDFVTYKYADGELVMGEFGWVTDLDYFDDIDEPVRLIKETLKRGPSEEITIKPSWQDDDEDEEVEVES